MRIPKIAINEMFESIQGEGSLTGYPTFFLRTQGCSIGCVWCDSKDSWKPKNEQYYLVTEILEKIQSEVKKDFWICITGGEPLEQTKSILWLVEKLIIDGFTKLSMETSGMLRWNKEERKFDLPDVKDLIDLYNMGMFFSLSPKLKSALKKRFNYDDLLEICRRFSSSVEVPFKLQYKFVASGEEDLDTLSKLYDDVVFESPLFLQIEDSKVNNFDFINLVFNFVKSHPKFRMTIQQHKVLNMR